MLFNVLALAYAHVGIYQKIVAHAVEKKKSASAVLFFLFEKTKTNQKFCYI